MAEQEEIKGGRATPEKAASEAEPDAVELTAPAGWTKKFVLSEDGTPRRNEILFISPTGEEIKSRRQLQQYLKTHPGSPPSAEFDWRTGDAPRRSARIREKAKAVEIPGDEKPKKRERKATTKKEIKEKATEGDEAFPVKEDVATEAKEDISMQEVADVETKVDDDANKATEEGVVVGESPNEKNDPVLESNRSDENKTEASSENKEATPRAEPTVSVPEDDKNCKHNSEEAFTGKEKHDGDISTDNSKHKEEPEDAVLKELPSASCGDAQHLPKASPVNC